MIEEELESDIQFALFAVHETPYSVWEWDLHERNLHFIESLNPEYFEYVVNSQAQLLETEYGRLAAVALRLAYGQGLETLFSIIGAALQAPDCVAGWLAKYRMADLQALVAKISRGQDILTKVNLDEISWRAVSRAVHAFELEDAAREQRVKDGFGNLWSRFARDFADPLITQEYNSIKHGLRIHAGGFAVQSARETTPGVPDPSAPRRTIGSSKYGCRFFAPEPLVGRAFRIREVSRNWVPENLGYGLLLISKSLRNVISFLRIANGVPGETVQFSTPTDEQDFKRPWTKSAGVTSFNLDSVIPVEAVSHFSDDEILSIYPSKSDSP